MFMGGTGSSFRVMPEVYVGVGGKHVWGLQDGSVEY